MTIEPTIHVPDAPAALLPATPRLRAGMTDLPHYRPGRRSGPGDGPTVKLSSNENPYPPLPGVLRAAVRAAAELNRYPDFGCTGLVEALAARYDVPTDHLAVSTGSVALLHQLAACTAGPGDEVVYAWRSFESYPIITQIAGARGVPVPLDGAARHDLDAMAAAVTDRTRLVLLCSPNNPTGTVIGAAELEAFLRWVPSDVLVVLDEAYAEFVRDPAAADGLDAYRRHANVCVLRTFSKAYGLAGLRVGYAIVRPPVAQALRDTAVPFGVSGMAQAAALASLDARQALLDRVTRLVAERARVAQRLRRDGWHPVVGQANFLWLPLGAGSARFAAQCADAGVLVRAYAEDGVRVTIGSAAENDRFLAAATRIAATRRESE